EYVRECDARFRTRWSLRVRRVAPSKLDCVRACRRQTQGSSSVDSGVRVVMCPIETVIPEEINLPETGALQRSRYGAALKIPFTPAFAIDQSKVCVGRAGFAIEISTPLRCRQAVLKSSHR